MDHDRSAEGVEPKRWKQKYQDDDGNVFYDAAAIAAMNEAGWSSLQVNTGASPLQRAASSGRAPRRASNARVRGSRRSRASSSSSDSGESGEPGESEPPRRRLCACCGRDIPADRGPRAIYIDETHGRRYRKRRQRERRRARDVTPKIPTTADFRKMVRLEPSELERLLSNATSACNGHHVLDAPRDADLGERCVLCGRQMPETMAGRKLLSQSAALRKAVMV